MKKFLTIGLALILGISLAQTLDPVDTSDKTELVAFDQSMNADLFVKINAERSANGLPELVYNFTMQNTVDQVAEGLKTNLCHCYGDSYKTETLALSGSVDDFIVSLSKSPKSKNPLKIKDIRSVSIGIADDKEHYYYVIRTFSYPTNSPPSDISRI